MARYAIPFVIVKDDEICYESEIQVSFTKKDIAELEQFVIDHDYSWEFVDIPAHMYDKCHRLAWDRALTEYKPLCNPELGFSMDFYEMMPDSLIDALSPEVAEKLCANIPEDYFDDEEDESDAELEEEETVERTESLYLTIKQVYFDQIINGTKKEEYREIKGTTFKKFLAVGDNDEPYINTDVFPQDKWGDYPYEMIFNIYNEGQCPLIARQDLGYLNLAVGYSKVRDTATVEVTDITFEPAKDKQGNIVRFVTEPDGGAVIDANGPYCIWNAVLHLGNITEKNIVSK